MQKSTRLHFISLIVIFFYSCTVLSAHEFWIEPIRFIVKETEKISANIRVGQMMRGAAYGYYPNNFNRFEIKTHTSLYPLIGRLGDKPAISISPKGNSLITIIHETTNSTVTYNSWTKFEDFLTEKSMLKIKELHIKNKYPKIGFKEIYSRYAKALIGSGDSIGIDQRIGLELELVLLQNPYVDDLSSGLTIELLYQGILRANTQIEIFTRGQDKVVARSTLFTNDDGQIIFKAIPKMDYMINAVVMRRPKETHDTIKKLILWESLWASTTFRIP
jgi:cobalt/nickel transport protein